MASGCHIIWRLEPSEPQDCCRLIVREDGPWGPWLESWCDGPTACTNGEGRICGMIRHYLTVLWDAKGLCLERHKRLG